VDTVVDEAGVALFAVAVLADLGDKVGQGRFADAAFPAGAAGVCYLGDRAPAVLADRARELLPRLTLARAQVRGLVVESSRGSGDDGDHAASARAAARSRPGARHHLARCGTATFTDGGDELTLAHAVAVADLGRIGQVLGAELGGSGQPAEGIGDGFGPRDLGQQCL